jgi:hypothetical protein
MDLLRIPGELQDLDKEEETLGRTYREGCSFIQMVMELNGTEGKDGLIKTFETELRTPIAVKSNQTLAGLNGMRISINTNVRVLKEKEGEIEAVSNQVSFKQLYEAISSLRKHSTDVCPACHTPLSKTVVDPFSHAESELMKLRHIGELQSDIAKQKERIAKQHAAVVRIINMCCDKFPDNNILKSYGIEYGVANAWEWWESLHHSIGDGLTPWMYLEKQVKELEELDEAISQAARIRSEKQNELDRLRDFNTAIISLKARREEAEKKLAKAKEEIKLFDTQNAQLILDVNAEQDTVTQNRIIAQAYASYVQRLSAYNSGLPAKLVADLGDTVVDLYNAFNRGDAENERLGTVRLPLQPSQRIEIAFMNAPNKFFDALYILSEGHIRCLGLAILAAKNIRENGPLLIFDDPVNAIDDEHRGAIRDTLFDGKLFEDKQIILACHGEEFFKDIQDQLSLRKAKLIKAYVFLPKEDDYNLRIDRHCTPRNYLIAARDCYSRGEIRSALSKSRQALESLAKNKVWKKYLPRYGDERLSLQLRSEKAPIELRNLVDKLAYKISEKDFPDPNKNAVLAPLESLLGVNGESREWRYLNKGTHEETDREEFDRQTVDVIITALEQLDAAVDRKK